MGKIIVANIMSLDGKYEGPGRNVMALPMDGAFDKFNLEHIEEAKVVLLGGNSYRFFGSFWPAMADNPEATPTNRKFSQIYNQVQKIAVSTNLAETDFPEAWRTTSRIISKDIYSQITQLKQETKGDIVIFASHVMWNDLLKHGLIDELHFVVGNVVLGEKATPILQEAIAYDDPQLKLELQSAKACADSNNFELQYVVKFS